MTVSRDAATGLEISNPERMFDPEPFAFSHLAIVPSGARTIFIAGQGGGRSPKGDFAKQVNNALRSIGMAMMAAGGAMGGVAKLTIYVVNHDKAKHAILIEQVRAAFTPRLTPTCTIVPLTQLGTDPDMLVEIEATGVLPKAASCAPGLHWLERRDDGSRL